MAKHTLTERAVKNSKPPAGCTETSLYDGGGLMLRVRNSPTGVLRAWLFQYARGGKRQRIGLGAHPTVSLAEAREKAQRYAELVAAGITPTAQLPTEAGRPLVPRTVDDLADRWVADYLAQRHADKGTAARAAYDRHVHAAIGRVRLVDVRKLHILHVVEPLARAEKARTAQYVLGLLRQMFTWAIRRDFMTTDPTAGLRKTDFGGPAVSRDRHLSPDEIRELAKRLQSSRRAGPKGRERTIPVLPPATQAAVWVMLSTLVRVGELTGARWEHINLEAGTWVLPETKNGQPHLIHLSPFAVRHLRYLHTYAAGSPWVMADRTGKEALDVKTITKQLTDRQRPPTSKRLGGRSTQSSALLLPGGVFTSHDLRRTGATLMRAAGVDLAIVERCLNHVEQNAMARVYQRAELLPERRAAFDALGAVLDGLVPPTATAHLEIAR